MGFQRFFWFFSVEILIFALFGFLNVSVGGPDFFGFFISVVCLVMGGGNIESRVVAGKIGTIKFEIVIGVSKKICLIQVF